MKRDLLDKLLKELPDPREYPFEHWNWERLRRAYRIAYGKAPSGDREQTIVALNQLYGVKNG